MSVRVYLAGPDVFLPHPEDRAAAQKLICAGHGLQGISPLDPLPDEPAAWQALGTARRIALCNEAHIRRCAAVIANLTPFRGPSADPGTVYEIGFARALGRPVFAYATTTMGYAARVRSQSGKQGDIGRDDEGMQIEEFGLFENLMIACAVDESGGVLVCEDRDRWTDLAVFERCVQQAARYFATSVTDAAVRQDQGIVVP